jgi:hypothetical protein
MTVMPYTVPLDEQLPWYQFPITLDSVTYNLELYLNNRASRWMLNIRDVSGNIVLAGIPLLIERPLTQPYTYLAIPSGIFVATDNTGNGAQPTAASFLLDHTLYYVSLNG